MIAGMIICATALLMGGNSTATAKSEKADKPKQVELLPIEASILRDTNIERKRYGLAALEIDPALLESARHHAAWMTNNQQLAHTNQPVAENIAMGQTSSAEVLQSWMNSSGHRANILNPGHARIGVAAYRTASGTVYWCQQFR